VLVLAFVLLIYASAAVEQAVGAVFAFVGYAYKLNAA
jgi:hypothetical protein